MTLDVDGLRAKTPGCAHSLHFNHAGASFVSRATLDAIVRHLEREAVRGPHEAAAEVQSELAETRRQAALLLNCDTEEIAFTGSGSAGWGMAFASLPRLSEGDRLLVGRQEWGGNLATMRAAADDAGAQVETMPCNADGTVDASRLAEMMDDRVRLVSLTWLPANGGLINDAAAVGRVANAAGVPFFVDAGQALGQLPVDVRAIGCDVLKGAGRKHLRGPRGTAILYVRKAFRERLRPRFYDVLSAPWVGGGPMPRPDARAFETSESPVALLLGLGNALKEANAIGIGSIRGRVKALAASVRRELGGIPGVVVREAGDELSGIVSFTVDGWEAAAVKDALAERGVTVGANGPAYTPLDMAARGLSGIVRVSVSYLNTPSEIDRLCRALEDCIRARDPTG